MAAFREKGETPNCRGREQTCSTGNFSPTAQTVNPGKRSLAHGLQRASLLGLHANQTSKYLTIPYTISAIFHPIGPVAPPI
jgi:hypothetical protein